MTDLAKAIYDYYNGVGVTAAALKSALTNGLWNTTAPQDTNYPYGTYSIVSLTQRINFIERYEDIIIQFNLFEDTTNSPVAINNLFDKLIAAFDFAELTVDNHTHIYMKRETSFLTKDENNIWQYNVSYRIYLKQT